MDKILLKPRFKALFNKIPYRRELLVACGLVLALIIFEAIFFQRHAFYELTLTYWATGRVWPVMLELLVYLLALSVVTTWVWFTFIANHSFRLLYQILFFAPLAIQYSYWQADGGFMDVQDFNIISNLGREAIPFTPVALLSYASPLMLVPMVGFSLLLLKFRPSAHPIRDGALFLLVIGQVMILLGASYLYQRWNVRTFQAPRSYNISVLAWDDFIKDATFSFLEQVTLAQLVREHNREQLDFQAASRPDHNIVLIIDESVRGDHLSLNGYERETTPYLDRLAAQGLIYNWRVAAAGATCSNQSVAALLTGVYELPDVDYQIQLKPTLFQYARAMNYTITVLDAEADGPRFHLSQEDYQLVDQFEGMGTFGSGYDNDRKMARAAAELLHQSTGNFVVIFKNGAHFPYNTRYPPETTVWSPVLPGEYSLWGERQQLVNSYDNALRYNLNTFFQSLLADPSLLQTTTFLYTADHGQALREGGVRHAHCDKTQGEARVPLLLITGYTYPVDEAYPAGHRNLFATLLDLMNVPKTQRLHAYAPSLFETPSRGVPSRYFLYGSLYGTGTYELVEFQ